MRNAAVLALALSMTGCAGIRFDGDEKKGLVYYDPKPHLFVTTNKDCVTTATVITLPEKRRAMEFRSGYGSSALSASVTNGMLASVGQTVDTKIPETITAISGLATSVGGLTKPAKTTAAPAPRKLGCKPTSTLYALQDGAVGEATTFPTPEMIPIEE